MAKQELTALRTQNTALREALAKYGTHIEYCPAHIKWAGWILGGVYQCDCGWDRARALTEQP